MLQAFGLTGAVLLLAFLVGGVSLAWSLGPRWRAALLALAFVTTLGTGLMAWNQRAEARFLMFERYADDNGGTNLCVICHVDDKGKPFCVWFNCAWAPQPSVPQLKQERQRLTQ